MIVLRKQPALTPLCTLSRWYTLANSGTPWGVRYTRLTSTGLNNVIALTMSWRQLLPQHLEQQPLLCWDKCLTEQGVAYYYAARMRDNKIYGWVGIYDPPCTVLKVVNTVHLPAIMIWTFSSPSSMRPAILLMPGVWNMFQLKKAHAVVKMLTIAKDRWATKQVQTASKHVALLRCG